VVECASSNIEKPLIADNVGASFTFWTSTVNVWVVVRAAPTKLVSSSTVTVIVTVPDVFDNGWKLN
jgi:hypothetical protein